MEEVLIGVSIGIVLAILLILFILGENLQKNEKKVASTLIITLLGIWYCYGFWYLICR